MHVKVFTYDPAVDDAPTYVEGDIDYRASMSCLELLTAFYEQYMPVSFDISCCRGVCGRCSMMINGEARLACLTAVKDQDYTFEPLKGFPVIRDLVVDRTAFNERVASAYDRVRLEPFTEQTIVPRDFDPERNALMKPINDCVRCGACQAACPVVAQMGDEYVGPAVMLATAYRHLDGLDAGGRLAEAVSNGLYRCIMCGACSDACMKNIDHLGVWQVLRADAEAAGLKPSYAE